MPCKRSFEHRVSRLRINVVRAAGHRQRRRGAVESITRELDEERGVQVACEVRVHGNALPLHATSRQRISEHQLSLSGMSGGE